MELRFEGPFDIEDSPDCAFDYLEVFDGYNQLYPSLLFDTGASFCGEVAPSKKIVSTGRDLFVHFHSDYSERRIGFKAADKTSSSSRARRQTTQRSVFNEDLKGNRRVKRSMETYEWQDPSFGGYWHDYVDIESGDQFDNLTEFDWRGAYSVSKSPDYSDFGYFALFARDGSDPSLQTSWSSAPSMQLSVTTPISFCRRPPSWATATFSTRCPIPASQGGAFIQILKTHRERANSTG